MGISDKLGNGQAIEIGHDLNFAGSNNMEL